MRSRVRLAPEKAGTSAQTARRSFWIYPFDVSRLFADLGEEGRKLHAVTAITLDTVFPIVYGALFAILIFRLYEPNRTGLIVVPLLAALADLFENRIVAYLELTYVKDHESTLAWSAAFRTIAKWLLFSMSLVLILVGGIMGFRRP